MFWHLFQRRKLFGPKRDDVTGNGENYIMMSLMRWAGHVVRMGERRGVYRVLVGNPEGKSPLGKPRFRWEDNIKVDLQEMGWGH